MNDLKDINDVIQKINDYVSDKSILIHLPRECCFINGWDYGDFKDLIKSYDIVKRAFMRILDAQEISLIKNGLDGTFSKPMSVYLLERLNSTFKDDFMESNIQALERILREDEEAANSFTGDEYDDDIDD
jgi:hypothetical protein